LLFLLVCVPFEVAARLAVSTIWAGGLALCKLAGFVEMLSATSSVINLTAVSVERYVMLPSQSAYGPQNDLRTLLCHVTSVELLFDVIRLSLEVHPSANMKLHLPSVS